MVTPKFEEYHSLSKYSLEKGRESPGQYQKELSPYGLGYPTLISPLEDIHLEQIRALLAESLAPVLIYIHIYTLDAPVRPGINPRPQSAQINVHNSSLFL